jgi:hypothetical protein
MPTVMNVLKRQHHEKGKVWFLIEISIQKQNASTFLLCIGKNISGQNRFKDEIGFWLFELLFMNQASLTSKNVDNRKFPQIFPGYSSSVLHLKQEGKTIDECQLFFLLFGNKTNV